LAAAAGAAFSRITEKKLHGSLAIDRVWNIWRNIKRASRSTREASGPFQPVHTYMPTDNKVSALVEKNEELIDKVVSAPSKAAPSKKLPSSRPTSAAKKFTPAKPASAKRAQSPKSSAPTTPPKELKPAAAPKKEAKEPTPPSAPTSSYADALKSSSTGKLPAPKAAVMQKLGPKKDAKTTPATKAGAEKKK